VHQAQNILTDAQLKREAHFVKLFTLGVQDFFHMVIFK